jgi:hypothetical protein
MEHNWFSSAQQSSIWPQKISRSSLEVMIHSKSLMTHGTLQYIIVWKTPKPMDFLWKLCYKFGAQWCSWSEEVVVQPIHRLECDYILDLNHIGPSWSPAALNTQYIHLHSKQHSPKIARSKIGGFQRLILSFAFKFCLCSWLGDHLGWNFETLITAQIP